MHTRIVGKAMYVHKHTVRNGLDTKRREAETGLETRPIRDVYVDVTYSQFAEFHKERVKTGVISPVRGGCLLSLSTFLALILVLHDFIKLWSTCNGFGGSIGDDSIRISVAQVMFG